MFLWHVGRSRLGASGEIRPRRSRGAPSPPRPIWFWEASSPDVWCPRSRLQLWPWMLRISLADPLRLGEVLSVTGFSRGRGRAGKAFIAGVRACRNLLAPSSGAGSPTDLHSPVPPMPMPVGFTPGLASWGQAGGPRLRTSVTQWVCKVGSDHWDHLSPACLDQGPGHWPRTAGPFLSLPQTPAA